MPYAVSMQPTVSTYSPEEERANALTHAFGTLVAAIAGLVLVVIAARHADPWRIVSASVFAASMVALYLASTLYHFATQPARKARLKVLDHCAIYLLIAGTYTPFTLMGLRGMLGWTLFGAIWALAAIGIVFKLFLTGRFRVLSTLIYIAMGWLVMIAYKPVIAALDPWSLRWLIAGGVAYTLGTVFYLRTSMRYSHAIWHLFVIAGTVCHFIAVLAQIRLPA